MPLPGRIIYEIRQIFRNRKVRFFFFYMITTAFGLKDRILIIDERCHCGVSKEKRWAPVLTLKLYPLYFSYHAIISKTIH